LLLNHLGLEETEEVVHIVLFLGDGVLEGVEVFLDKVDFGLIVFFGFGARLFYVVACADVYDDVVGIAETAWDVERVGEWNEDGSFFVDICDVFYASLEFGLSLLELSERTGEVREFLV